MLAQFLHNVEKKQLFSAHHKVLLAVSGGIDSMVLWHLFEKSEFNYGVVHCNFGLRGDESDGDELFVKEQAARNGVPFFSESYDTKEYAQLKGISIEMAARELRYEYFDRLRNSQGYDFIATAHHQDDLIETFFLNLSRKTGIKGLTGIKEKAGSVVRPMLVFSRNDIEQYASEYSIDYREDSSNREVVYQRNFLRHKIIPLFSEWNPSFKKNLLASIENIKDAEKVYFGHLVAEKLLVVKQNANEFVIGIEPLLKTQFPKILLLEIVSEFGFNSTVVDEIFHSLTTGSGKQFYSKTHRIIKDRSNLFVTAREEEKEVVYYIEEDDMELFAPFDISIEKLKVSDFEIIKKSNVACIDRDEIQFPLLIRKWKQGDYFQPLGMTGLKKVSDFFIDKKIPIHEKENTWILCSGKKIVWIIGHRLDNRFKITPESKQVLKIELK